MPPPRRLEPASLDQRLGGCAADAAAFLPCLVILLGPGWLLPAKGWALLVILANVVLLELRGQSLGKLAAGTRIVKEDTGEHPGFLRVVVLRWYLTNVLWTFVPYLVYDVYVMLKDERLRAHHDQLWGTLVVRERPSRPAEPGALGGRQGPAPSH